MKPYNKQNSNFWVSYAGLATGALLLPLLIVVYAVLKYSFPESEKLEQSKEILSLKTELENTNKRVKELLQQNIETTMTNNEVKQNIKNDNNELIKAVKDSENLKSIAINNLLRSFLDNKGFDKKTGTLTIKASNIFEKNKADIVFSEKAKLKGLFKKYFNAILDDDRIASNLQSITIECFTDTDGGYDHNLKLSQRRAYELLRFINSYNTDKRVDAVLIVGGRGQNNHIVKNGVEDKEASKRIEIKFSVSNKENLERITKLLKTQ